MSNEPKHRNEVHLAGLLAKDPDIRYSVTGKQVSNLTVITTFKNKNEFHRVVAWEKLAQKCEGLHKGDFIRVCGRLQTRSWQDQDGQKKYSTEIVAYTVALPSDDAEPPLTPDQVKESCKGGTTVARSILQPSKPVENIHGVGG
jgi:single stranded DNA-binding protein